MEAELTSRREAPSRRDHNKRLRHLDHPRTPANGHEQWLVSSHFFADREHRFSETEDEGGRYVQRSHSHSLTGSHGDDRTC